MKPILKLLWKFIFFVFLCNHAGVNAQAGPGSGGGMSANTYSKNSTLQILRQREKAEILKIQQKWANEMVVAGESPSHQATSATDSASSSESPNCFLDQKCLKLLEEDNIPCNLNDQRQKCKSKISKNKAMGKFKKGMRESNGGWGG